MRKTSLIFTGLLVILFATGQTSVQAVVITTLNTIISWGSGVLSTTISIEDETGKNVEKLMHQVDVMSYQLKHFANQMNIKLDIMLDTLLNHIELTAKLQAQKTQLLNHLQTVDYFFEESLRYSSGKSYANSTLKGFADSVLFGSNNLRRVIVGIHDIFIPGSHEELNSVFLSLIKAETELDLPTACQRLTSPQQLMYYIYAQLIIAEMRALITFKKAYTLKMWLENSSHNYEPELEDLMRNFAVGVENFYRLFKRKLTVIPRHLRRCHINTPRRGIDFVELEKLSRVKLLKPDFNEQLRCDCCPPLKLDYNENGVEMKAHSCKMLSRIVEACPAESGSPVDYSWWKDQSGTYGGYKSCAQPETFNAGSVALSSGMFMSAPAYHECSNWYCSVDEKMRQKNRFQHWRISSQPQISDIRNDMVVTGLRFIVKDKTIYLQIQEAKFLNVGLTHRLMRWKNIDRKYRYNATKIPEIFHFDQRLGFNKKTIFLDDIFVPTGTVVTGVRLARVNTASFFKLRVHATAFDFNTGKLDPSRSLWCYRHDCGSDIPTDDYVRDRIKIDMGEADHPLEGSGFSYDPESNKKIEFTHTGAYKEAGRTTIPFLDLQSVYSSPAFPITGIGLYYRGKEGFGGYIAPRIFTLDVTKTMTTYTNGRRI